MFLVNGIKAKLIQYNRSEDNNVYDDQNKKEIYIKCCPYNVSRGIRFGVDAIPEAKGYYQVGKNIDVKNGDQLIFLKRKNATYENETFTILNVQDVWLFNRIENKIIAVK